MMRRAAACFCAGPLLALYMGHAVLAGGYLDQFTPGDYPYDLAAEMQTRGCTMTETAMSRFLAGRGAHISDVQATIVDLANAGNLVWDKKESYTLVGWGKCR